MYNNTKILVYKHSADCGLSQIFLQPFQYKSFFIILQANLFLILIQSISYNDNTAKRGVFLKKSSHAVTASENSSLSQGTSVNADIHGIDVSAYNVITDYNKVKKAGVQFAILKIIRKDLRIDKLFTTHLDGFKSCGIPIIGVYNYSYATTVAKARADAEKVVSYLKQYGLKTTVYLDIEDDCQKNLGATLISVINAYQDIIEINGFQFGLYTGMSFYNSYIKPYKSSLKCDIEWIARYPSSASMKIADTLNVSKKPDVGIDIEGWQYSSTGVIDGISGKVDLNVFYGNKTSGSVITSPSVSTEAAIEFLGKISAKSGNLNIRFAPNSSSNIVGSYKKGEFVQLIARTSNNWYRTDKGYISGDHVIAAKGRVSNCNKLNMRKEPNAEGNNIVSVLSVDDEVCLMNIKDNGWYQVKTKDNLVGYVSNKYITII